MKNIIKDCQGNAISKMTTQNCSDRDYFGGKYAGQKEVISAFEEFLR